MTSPYYFKRGWDREKLAEYILSRFSFVAKPSTVSDDLGSDFFCTLFRIESKDGRDYPLPICSFAIQIKSSDDPFDFSSNINYIEGLEIPFFWGVLNEEAKCLSLYSGENFPLFFSHVGLVESLIIKPVERELMSSPYDPLESRKSNYTVLFPSILTIAVDSTREYLDSCVEGLQKICSFIHGNISTRKTEEYIFARYNEHSVAILAGPGSAKQYRNNFMKRLAENFFNLYFIYDSCPDQEKDLIKEDIINEFHIYEETYLKVKQLYDDVFPYPSGIYEKLKKIIG
jgi:hypothetical protein